MPDDADVRLTVAMPTFNGARYVGAALRSILAQRDEGARFELLVVDDRSDDSTLEVVHAMAGDKARVEVNGERLGLAGNWNRCVELSRNPWVSVFHQDDVMLSGHLAGHLASVAERPDLGMVCSGGDVIDDNGKDVPPSVVDWPVLGDKNELFEPGQFVRELAYSNPVRCSAVTLNKAAHAALGGFDARWRYAVDWEFWVRMARQYAVAWRCQRTVAVRWHGASETHRFKSGTLDLDEQVRLIDSVFEAEGRGWPDASMLRRAANRRLARGYLNRAYEAARAGRSELVRACLRRAVGFDTGVFLQIARDPRLAVRLMLGAARRQVM